MWETWVQSLSREDLLEKEMATHSSTLAWKIPWTEESGRLQSMGSQTVRHDWATSPSFHFSGERIHAPWPIQTAEYYSVLKETSIEPLNVVKETELCIIKLLFGH